MRHPLPRTPHPAVNVSVGAHSIIPSDHATRAGASKEVNVVADGTHAASVVIATLSGGGDVNAGGPGGRNSAVDDGL